MKQRTPKTVPELYALHEKLLSEAKALYDRKDQILEKLVHAWKKNKFARIDEGHTLEIEDAFRGQLKAFAPGFAHRYKLKLKAVQPE